MYKDLRLVEFEKREGQFGGILGGFVLMVVGGALLLAGVYASSTVGAAIPRADFSAAQNATYEEIMGNIFDGLAIGGVVVIIIGIVLLISALKAMA